MRVIYSVFFYLALPYIYIRLWWKGRKIPAYRHRWAQRLGFIHAFPVLPSSIWLHAVSVGELIAARPLILALHQRYPLQHIVITCMTATGSEIAKQYQNEKIHHVYVPYDVPFAIQQFLKRSNPVIAIVMETELWPNLHHYTAKRGAAILLANARLSHKSMQGYKRIGFLVHPMLQHISRIAAQSAEDAARFISLGADPERTVVYGNIKFDIPVPTALIEKGRSLRASWQGKRPVVIAASTHAGEEEQVLHAFAELRKTLPEALLILVPRHPNRFDDVAVLCQKQGFTFVRRSEQKECQLEDQIFLGDSLGELFLYYAAADVAFVGGSLVPVGGHNLLEPAAIGLPIVTGPQLFNFTEISQLLRQADALVGVEDEATLAKAWLQLLTDSTRSQEMGKRAMAVVEKNRGALEKHLAYITDVLKTKNIS